MANYPYRNFPANQDPIANDFIDVRGTGVVVTNASGHVVVTNDGGVALNPTVEAFGRYAHVEVTIGEVIAANGSGSYGGFGLLNASGVSSETGGLTVEFNGGASQLRVYAWDNAAQFYYSTVNTLNLASPAVGTDVFSLTTSENATADISDYEIRRNGTVIDSGTFAHKDNTAQLQPAFNSASGFGGGSFSHITARDALALDAAAPVFQADFTRSGISSSFTFSADRDCVATFLVTSVGALEPDTAAFDASNLTQSVTASTPTTFTLTGAEVGMRRIWCELQNVEGRAVQSLFFHTIASDEDRVSLASYDAGTSDVQATPALENGDVIVWTTQNGQVIVDESGNVNSDVGVETFTLYQIDESDGAVGATSTYTIPQGADTTPDIFTFDSQTGVALSSSVTSNPITIEGVDAGEDIPFSIIGGTYEVSTDGGSTFGAPTSANTNGQLGYQVRVNLATATENGVQTSLEFTAGGITRAFVVTTVEEVVVEPTPGSITDTITGEGATPYATPGVKVSVLDSNNNQVLYTTVDPDNEGTFTIESDALVAGNYRAIFIAASDEFIDFEDYAVN